MALLPILFLLLIQTSHLPNIYITSSIEKRVSVASGNFEFYAYIPIKISKQSKKASKKIIIFTKNLTNFYIYSFIAFFYAII